MMKLHRHQLLRLDERGWRKLLARDWDGQARACLSHWASEGLPLVVTRQPDSLPDRGVAVGLAAPTRWGRRRLALQVDRDEVLGFEEFPCAHAIAAQLSPVAREAWRSLCSSLDRAGVEARVHGSRGWQVVSGLRYVHADSDIDLCLPVRDADQADIAIQVLEEFAGAGRPRVDGELIFGDGTACAWREWQTWREGRCTRLLGKSLSGAAWFDPPGSRSLGVQEEAR